MSGDLPSVESVDDNPPPNPLDPSTTLVPPPLDTQLEEAHPPQPPLPEDSAVTKAEKFERHGQIKQTSCTDDIEAPAAKRVKVHDDASSSEPPSINGSGRVKGVVPIKAESVCQWRRILQRKDVSIT